VRETKVERGTVPAGTSPKVGAVSRRGTALVMIEAAEIMVPEGMTATTAMCFVASVFA
jgi:hypothetical protein